MQQLHVISYCRSPVLSDLLHHLCHHPLPSLEFLIVKCDNDSEFCALTAFLPQCTNLLRLYYERRLLVSESVEEEMWEAAVRRCRKLEVVRVRGKRADVSCRRLKRVLKRLSEKEGIQALKLTEIAMEDGRGNVKGDYAKQVKHLLPALQQ